MPQIGILNGYVFVCLENLGPPAFPASQTGSASGYVFLAVAALEDWLEFVTAQWAERQGWEQVSTT